MISRTSEMGRRYLDSASNVARAVADHNLKNMKLSSDNALRSFEYMAGIIRRTCTWKDALYATYAASPPRPR